MIHLFTHVLTSWLPAVTLISAGISLAITTAYAIRTRKKYYGEYINRKRRK